MAIAGAISILGVTAGGTIVYPRRLYAMAEHGDMPKIFAHLHPTYRTPTNAIVVSALLAMILACSGSYTELALLSVVARFIQYIPTCVAVSVFRQRFPASSEGFRIPFGMVVPSAAFLLSVVLLSQASIEKLGAGLIAMGVGVPVYFYMCRKQSALSE